MNRSRCHIAFAAGSLLIVAGLSNQAVGESPNGANVANAKALVQFDLPPIAVAKAEGEDRNEITFELRLSSMIVSPDAPSVHQWLVQVQPRDRSTWIVDYSPRTEAASEMASPIQIKNTTEEGNSMGIGLDGAYGHLARFHAAADQSQKQIQSVQFDRVAPVQAVTASGTINRGRGVYFKLRWTAQQVLEGEKSFRVTLRAPSHWRGGLVDVSVLAQGDRKSFAWERETTTMGAANFVVAVYREQDEPAETLAQSLAESEYALRILAAKQRVADSDSHSLPSMLRQVATKLDLDFDRRDSQPWLQRLLSGRADPHLDKQISRLPMPIRLAVLDYIDLRNDFLALNRQSAEESVEIFADHTASKSVLQ